MLYLSMLHFTFSILIWQFARSSFVAPWYYKNVRICVEYLLLAHKKLARQKFDLLERSVL